MTTDYAIFTSHSLVSAVTEDDEGLQFQRYCDAISSAILTKT